MLGINRLAELGFIKSCYLQTLLILDCSLTNSTCFENSRGMKYPKMGSNLKIFGFGFVQDLKSNICFGNLISSQEKIKILLCYFEVFFFLAHYYFINLKPKNLIVFKLMLKIKYLYFGNTHRRMSSIDLWKGR